MSGWIGVDLDGTLAEHYEWKGVDYIGPPIPLMVDRVKKWLSEGQEVKIFTARAQRVNEGEDPITPIEKWCLEHIGQVLEITNVKDRKMYQLWDDRAIQIVRNTGERVDCE